MAKALYFTYDGLLDPLGQSQIVPYILAISAAGHSLTIVSYEKVERSQEQIQLMERKLKNIGVKWVHLEFKLGKFWAMKRLVSGMLLIRKLCSHIQPDFMHLRGFVPAVIFKLSRSRVPYLYDFRGFALGEWVDIGKINPASLLYRILNRLDKNAVKSASGLVVLEQSAKRLLKETYDVPNVPFKVIRTCTDVKRYRKRENSGNKENSTLRFVFLGGARFPYRPDFALRLIQNLIKHGLDCYIDFINERDRVFIEKAIDLINISKDRVRILSHEHWEIPDVLATYDCGIIMVESSHWRRVCSPTKMGEYLAAGLPVISLEGIDAIDELSERTTCVATVSQEELLGHFKEGRVEQLESFIRCFGVAQQCQILALDEFDLESAGKLYVELYSEMEVRFNNETFTFNSHPIQQSHLSPKEYMIIGNEMLAKAFKSQGEIGSDVCIFASGVSNSNCKDKKEFSRENTLLQETLASHNRPAPFVYFGTCSVYDPAARHQPYVLHKLAMEKMVQDHPCGLVVRLPQVAGPNAPPNTLLAAISYSIRSGTTINVWKNATRNIIDVADVVNIASFMVALPSWQLKMVNIANPVSCQIMEIIESVESVLGQKAVLNLVSAGAPYDIDVSAIKPIINSLDIQFDKDYLTRTIARYYL